MTARLLKEVSDPESPVGEAVNTPQFTGSKEFFSRRAGASMEELMESPPQPAAFRPTAAEKQRDAMRPLRIGDLRLDADMKGAIEELGIDIDDSLPVEETEPRLDIEKCRALAEEIIRQVRFQCLSRERELLPQLSPEEQELMELTRPECLQERKPRDEVLYGSMEGIEEIKSRWESDVRALREEVERLRARVTDSDDAEISPLTKHKVMNLLQIHMQSDAALTEKCANAILESVEKDLGHRENQLRKELELIFESEKEQIREAYEEQMSKAVEETRREVTEFWQSKAKKPRADEVERMREGIIEEVESRLKAEYEEKLRKRVNQMVPRNRGEDAEIRERLRELEANRENQEIEFALRLEAEKEEWKRELTTLSLGEERKKLEVEFEQKLATRVQEIQEQSKAEITQMAAHFRQEAQQAISEHLHRLSEDTERKGDAVKNLLREECMREMRSERELKLADALAARLTVQLEKELRKDLTPKIEKEVRLMHEEQLRAQLRKEFEEVYETRRSQLEQEMRYKLRTAQERVEGKFEEDVSRLLAEKTSKIEKELKIKYKTKIERVKKQAEEDTKVEYERKKEAELVELRKEKSEVARIKSALNIQLKKAASDRKDMHESLHRQEMDLERRAKELAHQLTRMQVQEVLPPEPSKPSRLNPARSERPKTERDSRLSPKFSMEEDMIVTLPRPVTPPERSEEGRQYTERESERDVEPPPPPRFLPRYDSQDLVKQLITKNLEEAQREAISLLQQTEKPPVITSPYYPRETEVASTVKPQGNTPLYYRSKEAELRKEGVKLLDTQPQSARHQLYQELLKDRMKGTSHKN